MAADEPMTKKEADDFRRQISLLAECSVRNEYLKAYSDCAMKNGELPTPREIQELLCIWKVLWGWRNNVK